jgi:galactokinase/mevalonate kinase-like predicted kinase
VGLNDIVEIVPAKLFTFSHSGISIPGDASNNLCVKAYHLLKADFPEISNVQIHLHKNIPMGAGLGGGSGDGTTVLKILNNLFNLNPVKYTFKTDTKKQIHYGFIAQEIEGVYPELVKIGDSGHKTVNYVELIPLLVSQIQAMQKEIDDLKKHLHKDI